MNTWPTARHRTAEPILGPHRTAPIFGGAGQRRRRGTFSIILSLNVRRPGKVVRNKFTNGGASPLRTVSRAGRQWGRRRAETWRNKGGNGSQHKKKSTRRKRKTKPKFGRGSTAAFHGVQDSFQHNCRAAWGRVSQIRRSGKFACGTNLRTGVHPRSGQ